MDVSLRERGVLGFGPFRLDPVRRTLRRNGTEVVLTARLFDTLLYLVQNPDRLVTRDELESAVWGSRVVEDGNLQKAISSLRKALAGAEPAESLIITVPGRGFRFTSPVIFEPEATVAGRGYRFAAGVVFEPEPVHILRQDAVLTKEGRADDGIASVAPRLAKLSPPRLPATIARPRLFDTLDQHRSRKIIWVAGPPGGGKTTLLCSFLQSTNTPYLWYVIDAGDADPASFFYYLREAASGAGANGAQLPLLTAEYLQDIAGFTRRFFRTLIGNLARPLVLVLDNFQDAAGATVLNEIVRDAAGELGPGASLIVISRQEPPAALARLRANQELALLGWDELRLTEAESSAIALRQNPSLAAAAASLHARCDGWAAGLTLLLESVAAMATPQMPATMETPQALFDYFATELFESAPDDTRQVWLSTACLSNFTGQVASLLSGRQNATRVLEGLALRRTFTDRHVAGEVHYQYHALFREFLQQQLGRLYTPAARQDLALRSGHAAGGAGDLETALTLFEEIGAWNEASGLLLAHAEELFAQGRWQTLKSWLNRHPTERLTDLPWLAYWLGRCEGQTDPASGRATMETAYEGFRRTGDALGQMLSVCAVIETRLVDWTDFVGVERWIDLLEPMVMQQKSWPAAAVALRVHSVMLAALTSLKPQHDLVKTCIFSVWQACREDVGSGERLMAASALVLSLAWGAAPPMARAAVSEFEPLAALPETTPLQRCTWLSAASYSSLLDGEFAAWGRGWRKAGEIAAEGGLNFLASMCRLQYIWQPLVEGKLAEAESCLRPLVPRHDDKPMLVAFYHFQCAWLALLQDRPELALEHSEKFTIIGAPIAKTVRKVVSLNVHANALAACGHIDRALSVAKEAVDWFPQPGQGMVQFVSLMTQADLLRQAGPKSAFLAALSEAFATGRRGGLFITIPWLPKMVARLAETALEAGIEAEYVLELVKQRNFSAIR